MVGDGVRSDAYARALRECIRPNSIVLDIGTGVGIWALLACQFGARRVYAIEPNDVIQVAREIAAANGYADRIEFIQDISTRIASQTVTQFPNYFNNRDDANTIVADLSEKYTQKA